MSDFYKCSFCGKEFWVEFGKKWELCECGKEADIMNDFIFDEYYCEKCDNITKRNRKITNNSMFWKCEKCDEEIINIGAGMSYTKDEYVVRKQVLSSKKIMKPDFDHLISQEGLDLGKSVDDYRGKRRKMY